MRSCLMPELTTPDSPTHWRGGLVQAGMQVWFDRDSLPNRGTTFDQEIRRAIEASARLVLVVGPNALSREYVAQEWGFADDLGIPWFRSIRWPVPGSFWNAWRSARSRRVAKTILPRRWSKGLPGVRFSLCLTMCVTRMPRLPSWGRSVPAAGPY